MPVVTVADAAASRLVQGRHDDADDDDEHGLLLAKVVAMLVLGVCTLLLGLLPMVLAWRLRWGAADAEGGAEGGPAGGGPRSQLALALLRALGGGALLATTFLHMLPETREAVELLQGEGLLAATPFHLPETLVCAGFFMMYTVEELVHAYLHWRERKGAASAAPAEAAVHRSLSIRRCSGVSQGAAPAPAPAAAPEPPRSDECGRMHVHVVPDYGSVLPSKSNGALEAPAFAHGHAHSHAHSHAHGHGHSHLPPAVGGGVAAGLRGLLVVLALSVHELFEGLAVGLQTTAAHVYYLMGAVAAHKLVLAFCVGLELVAALTRPRLAALYVLVFAAVSPVGIGAGLALSGDGSGADAEHGVANTVLQGLASGTLLYVVFFEVLQRERAAAAGLGLRQLLAVVAGFGLMFGLLVAAGHEHNHDHDSHDLSASTLVGSQGRK